MQESTHTLAHTYNLNPLIENFYSLNLQFNSMVINNPNLTTSTQIQYNIIRSIIKNINNKLENFRFFNHARQRRGVINGLGSFIKVITGNLDSSDGDKINEIISQVKNNELNLHNANQYQLSINEHLVVEFNKIASTINHNSVEIESKIRTAIKEVNIINSRELFNEILIVYNMILETFRVIENSLTFCKLNIFHPDIVSSQQLSRELDKISRIYTDKLIFPSGLSNIINYETSLVTHCTIHSDHITYFISIPIFQKTIYNLLYLLPVPSIVKDEVVILIPKFSYVLRDQNSITNLNEICRQINNQFHCKPDNIIPEEDKCVTNIILHSNHQSCGYIPTNSTVNAVTRIKHSSYFLLYFPKGDVITIQEEDHTRTLHLYGLFMFKPKENTIVKFRNITVSSSSSQSYPYIIDNLNFSINQIPNVKLHLLPAHLSNLKQLPLFEFQNNNSTHSLYLQISNAVIFLFLILIITILIYFYKFHYKVQPTQQRVTSPPDFRDVPI